MARDLDRPVWAALASRHAAFAEGDHRAMRYDPAVAQFAAGADDGPDSAAALAALAAPGDSLIFLQADPPPALPGFEVLVAAPAVQMVAAEGKPAPAADPRIVALGPEDAAAMLELALLTKPGPFTLRALDLGRFWGVREDGRLVAMGGERLSLPGYAEASGLCTHPDRRGRGLGRALLLHVTAAIRGRGDVPFLHAWASNAGAIALYESLGYRLSREMHGAFLRRPPA